MIGQELGFRHVLVDEYQDLKNCDHQVIAHLEEFGAQLFVVGDDDQGIYGFAMPILMASVSLSPIGPVLVIISLVVCHRCPQNIVKLAGSLIALGSNPESSGRS